MKFKGIVLSFLITCTVCIAVYGLTTYFWVGRMDWPGAFSTALGVGITVPLLTAVMRWKK